MTGWHEKYARSIVGVVGVSLLWLAGCSEQPDMQSQNPSLSAGAGGFAVAGSSGAGAGPGGAGGNVGVGGGAGATMNPAGSAAAGAGGVGTGAGGAAGSANAGVSGAAGSIAAAGAGGVAGSTGAGAGGDAAPQRPDLGEGDGRDVITIGDSWMSLGSTGIQQSLVEVSGQPYRTYGRGGTRLLNEAIPNQYDTAKGADSDIKTVVMTGGGNDIIQVPGLRDDCANGGAMCQMVMTDILDRLSELWAEMAMDGVQDVIYVQYSNPEGNNVDFALSTGVSVTTRCAMVPAPLRCHTLPTLDIVMGDIPDNIHPSAAGYDRLGKAVHDLMIAKGMRR